MKVDYQKWWSSNLGQEMEMRVYGHAGKPVLVFPAQGGRYVEFEDSGMVKAVEDFIERGLIRVFTVDSVDNQSWANWSAEPVDRARRHEQYDGYITKEVVPFIRGLVDSGHGGVAQRIVTTGVSMGAYHAANFFFRHPDLFETMISMSGLYDLTYFIGDYCDENVYRNAPLFYLSAMKDEWFLSRYRQSKIIVCVGQGAWEEEMLRQTRNLQNVLISKGIPHWVDFWGQDVSHDWPWWRKMLPYFLGTLELGR